MTDVTTDLDVARLREVAEAATPGPWECDETSGVDDFHMGHVAVPVLEPMGYYGARLHDARFMATFDPPTVLALLDRLLDPVTARDTIARAKEAAAVYDEHHAAAVHASIDDPLRKVHSALGDLTHEVLAVLTALASQERGE